MKMKNEKEKAKAVPPITTLAELKAAIDRPLICAFLIDEREVNLTVKRINVVVDEQRRAIVRAVMPPWVKERNDYDMLNQRTGATATLRKTRRAR